jgi:hypothetical protein
VAGSCGHGSGPLSSIRGREFLDQLRALSACEGELCSMEFAFS